MCAEVAYQTGDQDFTAQLTQVVPAKAEALFVPGCFGDAAPIAKQLHQLGSKIPTPGGDALDAPELRSRHGAPPGAPSLETGTGNREKPSF